MIARAPSISSSSLIPSSKLGLVSIPNFGHVSPETFWETPDFNTEEARGLLHELGRNLGMTPLEARSEVFPEADSVLENTIAFPDAAIRKTLEALDVVWMNGNEVVAVFALETGLALREGVRKLADLLALHPKLRAALYVVSMATNKAGLIAEINRPVYRLLKKPLTESVRILDWTRLETEIGELGERVRYLKPEFLEGISDVVAPPAV